MTKKQLVERVHRILRVTTGQSEKVVNAVFAGIKRGIIEDGCVTMRGFGAWKTLDKPERMGRNPKTGSQAVITARTVVTFKAGTALRRAVNK